MGSRRPRSISSHRCRCSLATTATCSCGTEGTEVPVVAAAVCPHPPLLIPELAAGAAFELDPLRAACFTAVDRLADADTLLIVGSGPTTGARYDASATGTFGPYGAPDVTVGGSASAQDSGTPMLPLSLAV